MKSPLVYLEGRSLRVKLGLGFAVLMLLTLVIGISNLLTERTMREQLQVLYEKELLGVSNAKDVQINYLAIGRELRQAALAGPGKAREAALKAITESDAALQTELVALRGRLFRSETKAALAAFEQHYANYKANVAKASALLVQGAEAQAAAFIASDEFRRPGVAANDAITRLNTIKEAGARDTTEKAIEASISSFQNTAISLVGAIGFSLLLAWLIGRSIQRPTDKLKDAVERIASGSLDVAVPFTDYRNEVGSLARSVQVLQSASLQIETDSWLKNHVAACAQIMQSAQSFTALVQALFSHLAPLIQLGHGVFYMHEEDQRRLRMLCSYAYRERKELSQYFDVGQGLVGQCAMERAPITLQCPPDDYVRIGSSLGEAVPHTICVLPILRNERLLGVLELATFHGFESREQSLIDALLPLLANNLEILERGVQTNKLLHETREQARFMQDQAARLEEQTEELEAQQASLQVTEAWYRGIIESAPDGMLVCDGRGIITLTNPKLEAMFGYAVGELIGQAIESLVPQTIRRAHVDLRQGYIANGHAREMGAMNRELKGVRKDGSTFAVEVGLSTLPALSGTGVNVCASVRDITERKAVEDQIAMLEERSRLILGSVKDAVFGTDAEGHITFVNAAVTSMLGYQASELLGCAIHPLIHHHYPDGREFPRHACAMYQTSVDGQSRTVDSEVLWRKDGTSVPVEYTATPIHKGGAVIGTVVLVRDIAERQAQARAVRESEERLSLALQGGNLGLWDWQASPDTLMTNDIWSEMLGYKRQELDDLYGNVAARWANMVYPEDMDRAVANFTRFVNGDIQDYRIEMRMKTKTGEPKWILAVGGAVARDAQGKVSRMVGIHQDISERKEAEAAIASERLRLQTILDKSPICISISDVSDGTVLFANPIALKTFGLKVGDKAKSAYVNPAQRAEMIGLIQSQGFISDFEIDLYDSQQRPRTMMLTATITEHEGHTGLMAWQIDITDRKQAELQISHINFLNDQALDLTRAGHWHIPLNTGDEYYNSSERAASIFGDPPQPDWRYHLMNHWFVHVEAGDKEAAAKTFENFNAALAGTVPRYDAIYAYKRPIDGKVVWVHAMGHVVRDADGKPADMYGVTVDVTAAKLAEAQLEERMDELERFNRLTIDREEKMIELKKEVNEMLLKSGQDSKYRIVS